MNINNAILASLTGTLFGDILSVSDEQLATASNDCPDIDPKNEKELGVLTPIEAAFFITYDRMVAAARKSFDPETITGKEDLTELMENAAQVQEEMGTIRDFSWHLVKNRLPKTDEMYGLGLRKGNKIVQITQKKSGKREGSREGGFGMMVIEIGRG